MASLRIEPFMSGDQVGSPAQMTVTSRLVPPLTLENTEMVVAKAQPVSTSDSPVASG